MRATASCVVLSSVFTARAMSGQVTTAQYDNARTGAFLRKTVLTPRSVSAATFGKVATLAVDGDVYAVDDVCASQQALQLLLQAGHRSGPRVGSRANR
jgi:hypothetical protein